jgi:hypothetical protein
VGADELGTGSGRSAKSLGFEKEGDVGDLVWDLDVGLEPKRG